MKYVEIRVFEPEKRSHLAICRLDGIISHPARYRYIDCRMDEYGRIWARGSEIRGEFVDGICSNFRGEFHAEIVGEIDLNPEEFRDDRFELAEDLDNDCGAS